jgi:AcrR family transcriptional regulator
LPVENQDGSVSGGAAFAAVSSSEACLLALSPPQRLAIEMLTSGQTLVASATAAGVSRMTLYRWLKGDAVFLAAFNAWQKDVLDTARGRLLALSDLAVSTVAKSLSRGDANTALKVLKSLGVMDRAQPGSTDPEELERIQQLEIHKSKTALRKAEARAEMEAFEPL